ncbi:hypothetical protein LPB67_02380 [Undibacterium sp. Jales W-56]|uniref:hypothetical protein n=1 Tax=Undibacterium sp. Jales W-56 TaxID=2897325 RepID=UPI0021D1DB23|nr:hypothetical protein [Undibacterium sp. Jales W-56]MCU6432624.1 hypothetical protein [Undibacterium sp. Jales W-56]
MQLKNLADSALVALPDDLLWSDEHAWTPAVAAVSYLLTGALLVESAARQKGRPLTLVGSADMAWVTRETVNALYGWAALPSRQFELTLTDGRVFTVAFRHHETAIEAEPVTGFPARHNNDFYRLTLRLMEI